MPGLYNDTDPGWEIAPPIRLELRSGRVVTVALRYTRNVLGELRVQRKITSDTGNRQGGTWIQTRWDDINWLPRQSQTADYALDPDHFWAALRSALKSLDLIPTHVVV